MRHWRHTLTKTFRFLWDFFEIHLPAALLFILFLVFILQIIMRYAFSNPLTWSFELTLLLYVYVVLLGSCNALRTDDHVLFTVVYDAANERVKAWMRILSTVLIVVVFCMAMPSVVYYSWFIKVASLKKTTVLRIPYKYMYLAFLYMLWSSGILQLVKAGCDVRYLITGKPSGIFTLDSEGENA